MVAVDIDPSCADFRFTDLPVYLTPRVVAASKKRSLTMSLLPQNRSMSRIVHSCRFLGRASRTHNTGLGSLLRQLPALPYFCDHLAMATLRRAPAAEHGVFRQCVEGVEDLPIARLDALEQIDAKLGDHLLARA